MFDISNNARSRNGVSAAIIRVGGMKSKMRGKRSALALVAAMARMKRNEK
jgi:hypothetical protein